MPYFVSFGNAVQDERPVSVLPLQGFLVTNVVKKGDIYRVINGYDDCGNVCGRVTPSETNLQFGCKDNDKTKER